MRVVIAGGHGKIALLLERLLSQRGDAVAGLVRNPDHTADLADAGAEAIVVDLEKISADDLAGHLTGTDAVVFAAGAGAGSGPERKKTLDRDGAILLADAAEAAGVRRYVMVSSMAADANAPDDVADDAVMVEYLRAKGAADDDIRRRDTLDWTIVRPGLLTDDDGTGQVRIAEKTGRDSIPRADVAAVLLAVLDDPQTAGRTFEVVSGDRSIADALAAQ
ncbi:MULTISPECIES: SDR family oxidoreductase [Mycobacteriaceae]|uniref:SDR family oxidoreductase n=1 Tax=Mycobacteriaceae TaxID=1762 RepID=UPI0008014A7B|nr:MULTISPECIES: SDR family oxidoreductase [Mycobacteriaceae]MCK0172719.1 SDR family oxidoreductase [Mycolicibacterium sp. F2034L]OBB61892.1 NAD-dependent dehydratase [Mycobacterium sp. 852013-51886_SCH5428379]